MDGQSVGRKNSLKQQSVFRGAGILMLLAVSSLPAVAAGVKLAEDLTTLPLESLLEIEVQSASKFTQPISEAPSAVSVVTANDIKTFGWRTLADILNSLPGLYTTYDRNYTYLGARGFLRAGDYNPRFLILVDGNRTNDVIYDQAMMGTEFALDVDLIDRVEYVRGPGSSIYGSNAFFGVINVITKRGRDLNGAQASAELGSAGMRNGRVSVGKQWENGAELLLSATSYRRGGKDLYFPEFNSPETNNGIAQGRDHDHAQKLFAKGAAGPFNFTLVHSERTKGMPTGSYEQHFNDPRSRTVDEQTFANLAYARNLWEKTQLNARVFYNQAKYDGQYPYGAGAEEYSIDRSASRWWGGEAKLVSHYFKGHKLVAGMEYQKNDRVRLSNTVVETGETGMMIRGHNSRSGLYLQDEYRLLPDLLLNAGLRYDYNTALSSRSEVNPRVGLIYKWTPATTVKALYGKSYRVPNFWEMYYADVGSEQSQKANPDLRPERIRSAELIFEHQLGNNHRISLSAFRNKVTDLISQVVDPADGLLVYENTNSATATGVEFEWQKWWQDGMRLRTSASWQRAKDDMTGEVLANAPKFLAKLNLSAPFYKNLWRAGFEAQYVAPRNTQQQTRVGGYTLANLTLSSAKLIKGAEISFSVYNLFDHRYADPAGAEFTQAALEQDGRSFRVKLTCAF